MNITDKIRTALAYKKMSEAELARRFGSSPSAFNQRLKVGKFATEELQKIAEILDAEYVFEIVFPDGTRI